MHSTIVRPASSLRSPEEHAGVSKCTRRVDLQIVAICSAQNTGIFPVDLLLILCSGVENFVAGLMVIDATPIPAVAARIILRCIARGATHCWYRRRACHHLAGENLAVWQLAYLFLLRVLDLRTQRRHLRRLFNLHLLRIVLLPLRRILLVARHFGSLLRAVASLLYHLTIVVALLVALL